MVFIVTKAALAATIVGVGVTFGALSYLARRGQENNENGLLSSKFNKFNSDGSSSLRGYPSISLFTSSSENDPHPGPSLQGNSPLFSFPTGGFRLFGGGGSSTLSSLFLRDCNCKLIHECSTFFGGTSQSFRLRRTCGFEGFQRKICCDEGPFFSTSPPNLALDEVKSAHAHLHANSNESPCTHNHDPNGGISGCNCDHYQQNTYHAGNKDAATANGYGSGTSTTAGEGVTSTTRRPAKINFPNINEYFRDDAPVGSEDSTPQAIPFEAALFPNQGDNGGFSSKDRNDRIDAAFGEETTGKGILMNDGTVFPSLNNFFQEDKFPQIDVRTSLTTQPETTDTASTTKSSQDSQTTLLNNESVSTASTTEKTDQNGGDQIDTISVPQDVPKPIKFDASDITEAPESTTVKKDLQTSTLPSNEQFPDVTESIVQGSGTQSPQNLAFDQSLVNGNEGSSTVLPSEESSQTGTSPEAEITTTVKIKEEGSIDSLSSTVSSDRRPFALTGASNNINDFNEKVTTLNSVPEGDEGIEKDISTTLSSSQSETIPSKVSTTETTDAMISDDNAQTSPTSSSSVTENPGQDQNDKVIPTTVNSLQNDDIVSSKSTSENIGQTDTLTTMEPDVSQTISTTDRNLPEIEMTTPEVTISPLSSPDNLASSPVSTHIPASATRHASEEGTLDQLDDEQPATTISPQDDIVSSTISSYIPASATRHNSEEGSLDQLDDEQPTTTMTAQTSLSPIDSQTLSPIDSQTFSTNSETGNTESGTTTSSDEKQSTEPIPSQAPDADNVTTPSMQPNGEDGSSTQNPVIDQSITTTIQSLLDDIVDIFSALTTTTSSERNQPGEIQSTTISSKADLDESTTLFVTNEEITTKLPTTESGDMSEGERVSTSTTSPEEDQQTTTISSSPENVNFSDFPTGEDFSINELPTARKVATPSVGQSETKSPNELINDDGTLKSTTAMLVPPENKENEEVPTTQGTALESDVSTDAGNQMSTANPEQEEVTAGTLKIIEIPATTPMPKMTTTTMPNQSSDDETTTRQFSSSDDSLLDDMTSTTDAAANGENAESSTFNIQTTASSLTPDKNDENINIETTVGSTLENVSDDISVTTTSGPRIQTSDDSTDIPVLDDRSNVIVSTTTLKGITEESSTTHVEDTTVVSTMMTIMKDDESTSIEPSSGPTTVETETPPADSGDKTPEKDDGDISTINPSVLEIGQEEQTPVSLLKAEDDSTPTPLESTTISKDSNIPNVPSFETTLPTDEASNDKNTDTSTLNPQTNPSSPPPDENLNDTNIETTMSSTLENISDDISVTTTSIPNIQVSDDSTDIPMSDDRGGVILSTTKLSYEKTTFKIESSTKYIKDSTTIDTIKASMRNDQSPSTEPSSESTTTPKDNDNKYEDDSNISTINPSVLEMKQEEQTPASLLKGEDDSTLTPIEASTISKDTSDDPKLPIGFSVSTDSKEKSNSEVETITIMGSAVPSISILDSETTTTEAVANDENSESSTFGPDTVASSITPDNNDKDINIETTTDSTLENVSDDTSLTTTSIPSEQISDSSTDIPILDDRGDVILSTTKLSQETTTFNGITEKSSTTHVEDTTGLGTMKAIVNDDQSTSTGSPTTPKDTENKSNEGSSISTLNPSVLEMGQEEQTTVSFFKEEVDSTPTPPESTTISKDSNILNVPSLETTSPTGAAANDENAETSTFNPQSTESSLTTDNTEKDTNLETTMGPTLENVSDDISFTTSNVPNVQSSEGSTAVPMLDDRGDVILSTTKLSDESTTFKGITEESSTTHVEDTTVVGTMKTIMKDDESTSTDPSSGSTTLKTVPPDSGDKAPEKDDGDISTINPSALEIGQEEQTPVSLLKGEDDTTPTPVESTTVDVSDTTKLATKSSDSPNSKEKSNLETTPIPSTEESVGESSTTRDSYFNDEMATTPFESNIPPDTTTVGQKSVTEDEASTTPTTTIDQNSVTEDQAFTTSSTTGTIIAQDEVATTAMPKDVKSEGASTPKPDTETPMYDDLTTSTTGSSQDVTTDTIMNEELGTTTPKLQEEISNRAGETTTHTTVTNLDSSTTQKSTTAETTLNYDIKTPTFQDSSTTETEEATTTDSSVSEEEELTTTQKTTTKNSSKKKTSRKPGNDTSGSDEESGSSSGQDETTTVPTPVQTTTTEGSTESGEWVLVEDEIETTMSPFESMPQFGPMNPFGPMQSSNDQMNPFGQMQPSDNQMSPFGPMYPFQPTSSNESMYPFPPMPFWPVYDYETNGSPSEDGTMSQTTIQPPMKKGMLTTTVKPKSGSRNTDKNKISPAKSGTASFGITESTETTISPENQNDNIDYNDQTTDIELEPPVFDIEERTTFAPPDAQDLMGSKDSTTLPTLEDTGTGKDASTTIENVEDQDQTTTMSPQEEEKLMARTAGRLVPLPVYVPNEIAKVVEANVPTTEASQTSGDSISSTTTQPDNLDMTTNVMGAEETTPSVTDEIMKTTMNSLTNHTVKNEEVEMRTTETPESTTKQDGTSAEETTENKMDTGSTLQLDDRTFYNYDKTTSRTEDITTTENGVLMDDNNNESTTITSSATTEQSEMPEVVEEMITSTPIPVTLGDEDQTTSFAELGLKTSTLPSDSATTIMVPSDIVEMTTQQSDDEESTSGTVTITKDGIPSSTTVKSSAGAAPKDAMNVEITTAEITTENLLQDDFRDEFTEHATVIVEVTTGPPQSLVYETEVTQSQVTTTTKTVENTDGTKSPAIESIETEMTTDNVKESDLRDTLPEKSISMGKTTMTSLPETTTLPGENHESYAATTEYPDDENIVQDTTTSPDSENIPQSTAADSSDDNENLSETTTGTPDAGNIPQSGGEPLHDEIIPQATTLSPDRTESTSSGDIENPSFESTPQAITEKSEDDIFSQKFDPDTVPDATKKNPGAESSPQTTTDRLSTDDTLVFGDEEVEMTSTTPGPTAVPMSKDEIMMDEDGLPITEITKSIRREPDTDKTVVELTHMSSKEKNKVGKTVTAVRTGSEASVSEWTTESSVSATTGKTGTREALNPSTELPNMDVEAELTSFKPETTTELPNMDVEAELTSFKPETTTELPNIDAELTSFEPETTTGKIMTGESLVSDDRGDALEQTTMTNEKNDTEMLMARTAASGVPLPSGDESRFVGTTEGNVESGKDAKDDKVLFDIEEVPESGEGTTTDGPNLETTVVPEKPVVFDFEELPHSDEETATTTTAPDLETTTTTAPDLETTTTTDKNALNNTLDLEGLKDTDEDKKSETTSTPLVEEQSVPSSVESESTTKSGKDTDVVFDFEELQDSEETTVFGMEGVPTTLKPESNTKSVDDVVFDLEGMDDSDETTTAEKENIPTTLKQVESESTTERQVVDNVVFDLEGLHDSDESTDSTTTQKPPKPTPPKQKGKELKFAKPVDTVDPIEDMMEMGFEYNSTESVSTEETQHSSYLPPSTPRSIATKENSTMDLENNAAEESLELELPSPSTESILTNTEPVVDFNYNSSSPDINAVNTDPDTEPPTTQSYQDTTVPTALLEGFYETLFGPSGRSARVNNLGSGTYNYSILYDTPSTTVKTTTTPEPPFEIDVKVESPNPRYLFSSDTTPEEIKLKAEISNVVNQLLLTTHKNFNLLPNFVECAGARGRTGRRKTKVLHFDTDNYPWMARIGFKEPGGVLFPCAGTIISRRYILTSAQCALRKANGTASIMEILLEGAKNAAMGVSDQGQYKYKVEQVLPHPNYDAITRENDLALIRLAREIPSFNGSSDVKPICLPFEDGYGVWDSLPGEGETAYLGGWGYGLKNMAATVEEMEDAAVTIWSNENCTHLYRGDRMKKITQNNICAYGKAEKDACRGDSGGPLMALMTRQRIFFQIGVVSYGPRCGYGVPGVYTRVSYYLSWILDSMQP